MTIAIRSMEEELRRMALARHVASLGETGSSASSVLSLIHRPDFWKGQLPPHTSIRIGRKPIRAEWDLAGSIQKETTIAVGALTLLPPDADFSGTIESDAPVDYVCLSPIAIERGLEEIAPSFHGDFGSLYHAPFHSGLISALCQRLMDDTDAQNPLGPLYADSLIQTIVAELYCLSGQDLSASSTRNTDLPRDVLARIDAFVDERTNAAVNLQELADIAGMPLPRFSRSLKAKTGMPPYQYVLNRRLARARSLIETSRLSLAEIAYQCGFSSQSHMTDVFASKVGTTPGVIRKSVH